ncbi:MAG: alpha/beta hydrolase [Spirochaetaceae bacterium]
MVKVKSILHSTFINNMKQYYTVQTRDESLPLILFLHGGPGGANIGMSSVMDSNSSLTEHFTIIQYDQRGAGKSYNEEMIEDYISLDLLLDDIKKIIDEILQKFNKEKLYIIGHSFGTLLGVRLCKDIPSKIISYIGIAQLANMFESETLCTEEALKLCDIKNNNKAKKMINSSLEYFNDKNYPEYIKLQRLAMTKIGGFSYNRKPMNPSLLYIISVMSPHYSIKDGINMKKGLNYSTDMLWNEIMEINLINEVKEVYVPMYFILGKEDIVAIPSVAINFIDSLKAPIKKTIFFNKSGHSPHMEERKKYEDLVIELLK